MQIDAALLSSLNNIATRLRIESIRATTASASGHPTTCMSAAELMAALFFAEMRFDPKTPQHPEADRLVMSKGHAAPLLYAMWAEAGFIPRERLTDLRLFSSNLEGHPTPRLPFVDVATGSLGQGLAAGVGIALNARRIGSSYRTYVLMGDGETAEGSVWEAAASAQLSQARLAVRDSSTSTGSARAAPPSSITISKPIAFAGPRLAGTRSSSTATICRRCSPPTRRRAPPRAGPPSSWRARSRARACRSRKASRTGTASR